MMAWGTTGITDDELGRIAAVREYLSGQFPTFLIRDSYDPVRLAQVFHLERDAPPTHYIAVISTEFLQANSPPVIGTALASRGVVEQLRASNGKDVLVASWGIETAGADGQDDRTLPSG
jgi:hypothetical protein